MCGGRGSIRTAAWDVGAPEADQPPFSGRLPLLYYYGRPIYSSDARASSPGLTAPAFSAADWSASTSRDHS